MALLVLTCCYENWDRIVKCLQAEFFHILLS
jgi:hypothetical protein